MHPDNEWQNLAGEAVALCVSLTHGFDDDAVGRLKANALLRKLTDLNERAAKAA